MFISSLASVLNELNANKKKNFYWFESDSGRWRGQWEMQKTLLPFKLVFGRKKVVFWTHNILKITLDWWNHKSQGQMLPYYLYFLLIYFFFQHVAL